MARSLLRQLEQIRRSATYDDAVSGINTSAVAEPTVSGSLEDDMNVVRSLMKQVKGTTNWYDDLGTYWDPTATDSGNGTTKQMDLNNIMGKTTDAQTVLIAVREDNSGSFHAVSSGTASIDDVAITTQYATNADRTGLPIYNDGTVGSTDMRVCRVDVIDANTDVEFEDGSGNTVFALLTAGGTGSGTDVSFDFYVNDSSPTPYTFDGSEGVSNVYFIYPQRKVMADVAEYEWMRTDFVSSWEGDVELVEDISNLWSFTGAGDNITSPTWTNTTGNYPLSGDPSDLEAAINALNDAIDNMTFTEDNYIADGDTVADALDKLDQALKDVEESVTAGVADKYVESISSGFSAGTLHSLPYSITYTPDSTAGQEGSNMDVFVDGQLLAASTGAAGANADRDYQETTASGITFHFDIQVGRNITYMVRQ
jgi:hypothetical protein